MQRTVKQAIIKAVKNTINADGTVSATLTTETVTHCNDIDKAIKVFKKMNPTLTVIEVIKGTCLTTMPDEVWLEMATANEFVPDEQ